MRPDVAVRFNRAERDAFARVAVSLGVAFPGWPYPKDRHENALVTAVSGIANQSSTVPYAALDRAREALEAQAAQCQAESSYDYWTGALLRPVPAGAAPPNNGGSSLVADPEAMCRYLAQTRAVQLREAREALALVRQALSISTAPRPDDDDE